MDINVAGPSNYALVKRKHTHDARQFTICQIAHGGYDDGDDPLQQQHDNNNNNNVTATWDPCDRTPSLSSSSPLPTSKLTKDDESSMRIRAGQDTISESEFMCNRNNNNSSRRRRRRKRLKSSPDSFGSLSLILLSAIAITVLLPVCIAQDTSFTSTSISASSTRTATSTSTTTSISGSSTSTSTASASATRTYSLSTLPTSLSLPALNTSSPAIQLDLPSISSIYLTFSICTLTSDQTLLPNILISIDDPPNFDLSSSSKLVNDASSGGLGTGKTGWNQRTGKNGGTWLINWEKGFGNFTISTSSSSADDDDDGDGAGEGAVIDDGEQVPISILFDLSTEDDDADDGESGVTGDLVIQMSASTDGPLNSISSSLPLLGDTTSSLALLFSPLLISTPKDGPSYPNYTLPSPQLVFEPFSSLGDVGIPTVSGNSSLSNTNLTLALIPTSSSPTNSGLDYSICAIRNTLNSTGDLASTASGNIVLKTAVDEPQWSTLDEEEGYRHFWAVGGLTAEGNYTAWVMDGEGTLSGPIWFVMKQESFPCNIVLPTSICPNIAYAAPLPANITNTDPGSDSTATINAPIQSLPDETTALLTSNLESFSTSLLSHACGRDLYSHVSSCRDCFDAYRQWLCRTVIPQCSVPNGTTTTTTSSSSSSGNGDIFPTPQIVHRTPSSSSSSEKEKDPLSSLPTIEGEYDQLLPCLSNCNKVDRACPVDMGFRCPRRHVNAELDYAFWGDDNEVGHGGKGDIVPSYDKYGRRWCSG
ncbi:hypothetical protein IAT40_006941 [Kwoniella sp. CBS 6097]